MKLFLFAFALIQFAVLAAAGQTAERQSLNSGDLEFEGSKVFGNQKLLEITNKCRAEYSKSTAQEEAIIDYCLHRTTASIRAKGYLQANLGKPTTKTTDAGVVLTVPVDEGALYRLGEVRIGGATAFSPARLRGMLGLKAGEIVDGEAVSQWLFDSVKRAYSEIGYIQYTAEVEPTYNLRQDAAEGTVDLAITIDEGRPFYVRSITFDGNGEIPQSLLLAHMLIRSGDIFNSELLNESLRKIDQAKQFEPIDSDKDVDYRSKPDSNHLNITIHLKIRH